MDRSGYFTRGIIIITVLLVSVVVSFFLGKILGNELMAGGKEKLKPFITSGDEGETATGETVLMGTYHSDPGYNGPTPDRVDTSWATSSIEETPADGSPVSIEPVEQGESEGDGDTAGMASLFGLGGSSGGDEDKVVFRVQVGVFTVKDNAEKLAATLRYELYNAYSQRVEAADGEVQWKVFVGPFPTLEAANTAAEDLRERSYEAFVR